MNRRERLLGRLCAIVGHRWDAYHRAPYSTAWRCRTCHGMSYLRNPELPTGGSVRTR